MKLRLQRLGADYQNYQKRMQKQLEQAGQFAREDIVKTLIPILDNFEHALEKGTETDDPQALLQGMKIVYDQLMGDLVKNGMLRIEVLPGDPFDPSFHEAMLREESDSQPENTIIREFARGYKMNDRVLRPAKVSVARPPVAPAPDNTDSVNSDTESEGQTETESDQ